MHEQESCTSSEEAARSSEEGEASSPDGAPSSTPLHTSYDIRLRGELSPGLVALFDPMEARVGDGETVLHGAVPDQEKLFAILERAQSLGLELVDVHRSPTDGDKED